MCIPVSTVPNLFALRSAACGDLVVPRRRLQLCNQAFCVCQWCYRCLYHVCIRVATFALFKSATGSEGITRGKFWNSICNLVHFEAIWCQLFVGRNFATKIEPNCQLQCAHDCTVLLLLLSNEYALTQLLIIKITGISVRTMTVTTYK